MTSETVLGSGTESPVDFDPTGRLRQRSDQALETSSAEAWSKNLTVYMPDFSGDPSWTDAEQKEVLLAYSGFMNGGNWAWLGNCSEVRLHEGFERLLGYMGYRFEVEPIERQSSSTAIHLEPRKDIGKAIENLFNLGRNELFEDGMESHFSNELIWLVKRHSELAILEVARLIVSEKADPRVASEALKWLGRIKHVDSASFRLWLLLRGLTSSSPLVREGAGLGLSFMNEPMAIPFLSQAVERERISELQDDLRLVLEQLQHAP